MQRIAFELIRTTASALEARVLRLVVGADGRAARGAGATVDGSAVAILLATHRGSHRGAIEWLLELIPLGWLVAWLAHRISRLNAHHAEYSDSGHAGIGGLVMGHGSLCKCEINVYI